jgi:hypothetical protein
MGEIYRQIAMPWPDPTKFHIRLVQPANKPVERASASVVGGASRIPYPVSRIPPRQAGISLSSTSRNPLLGSRNPSQVHFHFIGRLNPSAIRCLIR